ncbi:MAG: hypothetical protein IPM00_16220 [Tetrasphaera sp.]|nr:hypothetical protein [Tetrasphaera sp.]
MQTRAHLTQETAGAADHRWADRDPLGRARITVPPSGMPPGALGMPLGSVDGRLTVEGVG